MNPRDRGRRGRIPGLPGGLVSMPKVCTIYTAVEYIRYMKAPLCIELQVEL